MSLFCSLWSLLRLYATRSMLTEWMQLQISCLHNHRHIMVPCIVLESPVSMHTTSHNHYLLKLFWQLIWIGIDNYNIQVINLWAGILMEWCAFCNRKTTAIQTVAKPVCSILSTPGMISCCGRSRGSEPSCQWTMLAWKAVCAHACWKMWPTTCQRHSSATYGVEWSRWSFLVLREMRAWLSR